MRIEAFALAWNIRINQYPYIQAINSIMPFANKLVINYLQSEDDTLEILKKLREDYRLNLEIEIVEQPPEEYLPLLKAGEGNKFLNITKNYARSRCHKGFVWLMDLDETLNSSQFRHIKDIMGIVRASAYWFPFLHYWGDRRHIVEGKYYSAACRLFQNYPVIGDGWTGFSPGFHTFLPGFFVEHHGMLIKARWQHKQRMYPDADMEKDATTHDGHVYRIKQVKPRGFCRPLNLAKVELENRHYTNIEIMRHPVFEKMLFCGLLANENLIVEAEDTDGFGVNQMTLSRI